MSNRPVSPISHHILCPSCQNHTWHTCNNLIKLQIDQLGESACVMCAPFSYWLTEDILVLTTLYLSSLWKAIKEISEEWNGKTPSKREICERRRIHDPREWSREPQEWSMIHDPREWSREPHRIERRGCKQLNSHLLLKHIRAHCNHTRATFYVFFKWWDEKPRKSGYIDIAQIQVQYLSKLTTNTETATLQMK